MDTAKHIEGFISYSDLSKLVANEARLCLIPRDKKLMSVLRESRSAASFSFLKGLPTAAGNYVYTFSVTLVFMTLLLRISSLAFLSSVAINGNDCIKK